MERLMYTEDRSDCSYFTCCISQTYIWWQTGTLMSSVPVQTGWKRTAARPGWPEKENDVRQSAWRSEKPELRQELTPHTSTQSLIRWLSALSCRSLSSCLPSSSPVKTFFLANSFDSSPSPVVNSTFCNNKKKHTISMHVECSDMKCTLCLWHMSNCINRSHWLIASNLIFIKLCIQIHFASVFRDFTLNGTACCSFYTMTLQIRELNNGLTVTAKINGSRCRWKAFLFSDVAFRRLKSKRLSHTWSVTNLLTSSSLGRKSFQFRPASFHKAPTFLGVWWRKKKNALKLIDYKRTY